MIRSLIIDDELKSCNVLKKLLSDYCPEVEVITSVSSAEEARQAVTIHAPDLIFLDIEMPKGDGFYFLQSLTDINFGIIFITAYDQYAIKAFRFSALDYLLKPINIDLLCHAVQKFKVYRNSTESKRYDVLKHNHLRKDFYKIAIPTRDGFDFIDVNEILWLQASNIYTIFYLSDQRQIVSSQNLGSYESMLCDTGGFLRIHHSHIINFRHIVKIKRAKNLSVVMSDGKELDVSQRKKDVLLEWVNKLRSV